MKLWGKRARVRPRKEGREGERGFTLIETALATTVMMIALMSASMATLRMHTLRRQNREQVLAHNALRSVAEQIHAVAGSLQGTEELEDWHNAILDAFGPGGTVGSTFELEGLTPVDADTPVGTVAIFTDETATDADVGFEMGLPRDLNGDDEVDDTNVVDGVGEPARILPVLLTVRWVGISGESRLDHGFYVLGY